MPGQWHPLQEGEKSRCLYYSRRFASGILLPNVHIVKLIVFDLHLLFNELYRASNLRIMYIMLNLTLELLF